MARYNTRQYNSAQYNTDALFSVINLPADVFSIVDNTVVKTVTIGAIFAESLSMSESIAKSISRPTSDFLVMLEQITKKNVDIKGLADSLDIDLWLTIDKNDNNSKFTEQ